MMLQYEEGAEEYDDYYKWKSLLNLSIHCIQFPLVSGYQGDAYYWNCNVTHMQCYSILGKDLRKANAETLREALSRTIQFLHSQGIVWGDAQHSIRFHRIRVRKSKFARH